MYKGIFSKIKVPMEVLEERFSYVLHSWKLFKIEIRPIHKLASMHVI